MRTFIAVDLPQEAKDALADAQKQLSKSSARMSLAHDFHLTLKFLGEINPAKAEAVKRCLENVKFKKFSAAISGIGAFPSESCVRVVWAGVKPEGEFASLQRQIDEALEKEFPKDKPFRPHLTLARVKLVSDKKQFARQLQGLKVKSVEFPVGSFRLKRSALHGKDGHVYDDLGTYASVGKVF